MPAASSLSTQPSASGIIRRDADKIDLFPARQRDNTLDIRRLDLRDAPRDLRNARVARRAEDLRHVLRFRSAFLHTACSRPPPPITNTFINILLNAKTASLPPARGDPKGR